MLPNTPLVYYPDTLMETGVIVYLLSKVCLIRLAVDKVQP